MNTLEIKKIQKGKPEERKKNAKTTQELRESESQTNDTVCSVFR